MKILQVSSTIYNSKNNSHNNVRLLSYSNDRISFSGVTPKPSFFDFIKKPYRKIMEPIEEKIANGLAWLIQTKPAKKIIIETAKRDNFGDKLFPHLIVLGSTLLSGFYIAKTLTNDKLDEIKRKTLAINQTAVFVASTILAYTFDGIMNKKTDAIKNEFKRINEGKPGWTGDHLKGIEAAKKIMIFTTMYRFIAPVLVTPLANYIGNRLQNKKDAELVFGNKLKESK